MSSLGHFLWQQARLSYCCVVNQILKKEEKEMGETNWWARSPCCDCHPPLESPCRLLRCSLNQTGNTECPITDFLAIKKLITLNNKIFSTFTIYIQRTDVRLGSRRLPTETDGKPASHCNPGTEVRCDSECEAGPVAGGFLNTNRSWLEASLTL